MEKETQKELQKELIGDFLKIIESLQEKRSELKDLVRHMPDHLGRRARSYWLAQFSMSIDSESGWVGSSENMMKDAREWANHFGMEVDDEMEVTEIEAEEQEGEE